MRPPVERAAEFGEASESRHQADAGHGTACDGTSEKVGELWKTRDEKIPVPERRPWGHDENQPRFEKIGGEQQTRDKRDNQPPDIPANRSVRAATSRYSDPSA